jgi:ubiquinone biosynthesis protein
VQPFAKKLLRDKYNPLELAKNNYPKIIDFIRYMAEFPGIAFEVSEMLRDGKIKIGIEDKGLQPALKNSRKNSQIIAYSIISASIFISSSLIISAKIPPFWHNLSIAGLFGLVLSGAFAFAAIRKGKS